MTRIEFEDAYGKYTVEVKKDVITATAVVEDLLIPALMAAGYSDEVIRKALASQDVV